MLRIPDLDAPLGDGRVSLRPAAERDIPEVLIAHQDDPRLYLELGLRRPPSGAELGLAIEQEPARRDAGSGVNLTIVEAGIGSFAGQLEVRGVEWDHARAELAVWIVPAARGRHLARAALRLGAVWLFQKCGIERVQLLTRPDNEALIRASLGAGFVLEGTPRAREPEQGRSGERATLSLLLTDLAGAT